MKEYNTIVDGHAHTFTDDAAPKILQSFNRMYSIDFENTGTGTIDDLLNNMTASGVGFTVMANFAPPKILHTNNLWTISAAKEHRNLISLISFHPDMEGSFGEYVDTYMEMGARGVKIHPMAQGFEPDNKRMKEVYRQCGSWGYPIVFHCGRVSNARLNDFADVEKIIPVLDKFPDTPFVLTHMADGNIEDVLFLTQNFENVYFDTSIVISGYAPILATNEPSWKDDDTVIDVINSTGAHRVLFGSDYPWGSPKLDIERITRLRLEDDQKQMILGRNAIQLFKISLK